MLKKKEITIDDLARMVQQGFDEVADNFKVVNSKLEEAAKKKDVDKRFDKVEKRLDEMGHKINQIDRRLFSIEEDVAEIKIKQYGDLLKRINFIERKLGIANAN